MGQGGLCFGVFHGLEGGGHRRSIPSFRCNWAIRFRGVLTAAHPPGNGPSRSGRDIGDGGTTLRKKVDCRFFSSKDFRTPRYVNCVVIMYWVGKETPYVFLR